MRVLVIRLSSFGDIIHAMPAITDLARARPGTEIDWLVGAPYAELVRAHPSVSAAVPFAERQLRWPPSRWPSLAAATIDLSARLRDRSYDLVVDLQGLIKSALLARLVSAPRVGMDRRSAREPLASRFYTRRVAVSRDKHAVARARALMAVACGYPVPTTEPEFGLRKKPKAPADLQLPERFGLIVPSATWSSKMWPEENWRALVDQLGRHETKVLVAWGSTMEQARALRLASGNPQAAPLPRRLGLAELAAVVARARWAIGVDTGPMQLCAALNVPGVWLFGPTNQNLTGPIGPRQRTIFSSFPAAPCRQRTCQLEPEGLCCMRAISLTQVLREFDALRAA